MMVADVTYLGMDAALLAADMTPPDRLPGEPLWAYVRRGGYPPGAWAGPPQERNHPYAWPDGSAWKETP